MARRLSSGFGRRIGCSARHPAPAPAICSPPFNDEGFAWGIGFAIARRIVDGIIGPLKVKSESDVCSAPSKALFKCLNESGGHISQCEGFMTRLAECRKRTATGSAAKPYII